MPLLPLPSEPRGASTPYHPREIERLTSLVGLHLDAVEPEPLFDEIARQAAALCGARFGAVSIVREHEQAFLGNYNLPGGGSAREEAICAHTIMEREALVVEDLRKDARFAALDVVTGATRARFYAGVPLFDPAGLPLGTVCVLDTEPRDLCGWAVFALARLATKAGVLIEARRLVAEMLGPSPHPVALHKALQKMNGVMEPLFARCQTPRPGASPEGAGPLAPRCVRGAAPGDQELTSTYPGGSPSSILSGADSLREYYAI